LRRIATERLVEHASSEFLRLLTMAGMDVPADCHAHDDNDDDGEWEVDQGDGGEGRHRPNDRLERRMP
jgi:hypothetical protein